MKETPAKLLRARAIVDSIKESQVKSVEELHKQYEITPKLAIVKAKDDPVIAMYVGVKKRYGASIGCKVDIHDVEQKEVLRLLEKLNSDRDVHGIIVQLPLEETSQTEEILNTVSLQKDVDGLAAGSSFYPATPTAILLLLSGHNVELENKNVVVVGRGALVGGPLIRMLEKQGVKFEVITKSTEDPEKVASKADVLISATGVPGIIKNSWVKKGAVVIDAGTATATGKIVGDVEEALFQREDIRITPKKGGVGPLTVCALFQNLIKAAKSNDF